MISNVPQVELGFMVESEEEWSRGRAVQSSRGVSFLEKILPY